MKKFSKIMALSMALALTFGMTVCAADSPDVEQEWVDQATESSEATATKDGEEVQVDINVKKATGEAAKASLEKTVQNADDTLTKAIQEASKLGTINTPELLITIDIEVTKELGGALDEGTEVTVTVPCEGLKQEAGYKYVLMHLKDGTTWEAISEVTIGNGTFTFKSSSFSNYALFKVSEKVTTSPTTTPSSSPAPAPAAAPASEPVSPKTGESVPVAGFAALILLAGAAVCAKKVQLNN